VIILKHDDFRIFHIVYIKKLPDKNRFRYSVKIPLMFEEASFSYKQLYFLIKQFMSPSGVSLEKSTVPCLKRSINY